MQDYIYSRWEETPAETAEKWRWFDRSLQAYVGCFALYAIVEIFDLRRFADMFIR
jgi:hypothetical protein